MKKITLAFSLLTFILLFFCNTSIAQETIYVTLNVDTAEVKTQDTHSYCYFNGQSESMDTRDFTINANVGDIIVWNAVSTTSDKDQVKITAINYEGGTNVFTASQMKGQNGVVTGKINKDTAGKEAYKYTVSFKIMSNGSLRPGTFQIDPKIKVGS